MRPKITDFTKKAMIKLPDGTIVVGDTHDWTFLDNGLVCIEIDGIDYIVHGMNLAIMDRDE